MFAPKTKFPSFRAALPFPSTIITNYCFSAILKGLKLSSSSSAVNSSQFDNCQSFCCHVCPENKISDFWRRSTLSKYNYYKLLLFCNFKRFEAKQFFYSNQSLEMHLHWLFLAVPDSFGKSGPIMSCVSLTQLVPRSNSRLLDLNYLPISRETIRF